MLIMMVISIGFGIYEGWEFGKEIPPFSLMGTLLLMHVVVFANALLALGICHHFQQHFKRTNP
jgi:hypothetical protein